MLTFGYWNLSSNKKQYPSAAEAERAARRYAKRENTKVELYGWLEGVSEGGKGYECLAYVWPSGQTDLTFEGSYFL